MKNINEYFNNILKRKSNTQEKYSVAFSKAITIVLKHEGGYVNHPNDPGGETKFGITKRSYPHLQISELTKEDAIQIYYDDWWIKNGYDKYIHPKLAAKMFDTAINMGVKQSNKLLQRALRSVGNISIIDDGIVGPKTINAMSKSNECELLASYRSEQAGYYRVLIAKKPKLKVFKQGWLNRAYS